MCVRARARVLLVVSKRLMTFSNNVDLTELYNSIKKKLKLTGVFSTKSLMNFK